MTKDLDSIMDSDSTKDPDEMKGSPVTYRQEGQGYVAGSRSSLPCVQFDLQQSQLWPPDCQHHLLHLARLSPAAGPVLWMTSKRSHHEDAPGVSVPP